MNLYFLSLLLKNLPSINVFCQLQMTAQRYNYKNNLLPTTPNGFTSANYAV